MSGRFAISIFRIETETAETRGVVDIPGYDHRETKAAVDDPNLPVEKLLPAHFEAGHLTAGIIGQGGNGLFFVVQRRKNISVEIGESPTAGVGDFTGNGVPVQGPQGIGEGLQRSTINGGQPHIPRRDAQGKGRVPQQGELPVVDNVSRGLGRQVLGGLYGLTEGAVSAVRPGGEGYFEVIIIHHPVTVGEYQPGGSHQRDPAGR